MDSAKRKELMNNYKTQQERVIGGIYCIECSGNNRKIVKSTVDMESARSRFLFGVQIKACPDPAFQREWTQYGEGAFNFTVLEELEKGATQTPQQFADDVKALYDMWLKTHGE